MDIISQVNDIMKGHIGNTFSNKKDVITEKLPREEFDKKYGTGHEIFTHEDLTKYGENLEKAILEDPINKDSYLEKGRKDLSKLTKKQITDKSGHTKTVYVRAQEGEGDSKN